MAFFPNLCLRVDKEVGRGSYAALAVLHLDDDDLMMQGMVFEEYGDRLRVPLGHHSRQLVHEEEVGTESISLVKILRGQEP